MQIGDILNLKKQRYECVGFPAYQTRRGEPSTMIELASHCAECGAPFRLRITKGAVRKREFNRRCDRHKRPGVRVPDVLAPPQREAVMGSAQGRISKHPNTASRTLKSG